MEVDEDTRRTSEALAALAVSGLRAGGSREIGRDRLMQAVSTGGAPAVAYYNLAILDAGAGDIEAAIVNAMKAVELSGGNSLAVAFCVRLMIDAGRADLLETAFDRFLDINPDSTSLILGLAEARIANRKVSEGLALATEVLRKDETNTEAMKVVARAWLAMDRLDSAEYVLAQALQVRKDAELLDILGQIAWRKGDATRAMALFRQAVDLDGGLIGARNNLAVLYQNAGDVEGAARELQEAIRRAPAYWQAHANLGNVWRRMHEFDRAIVAFNEALRLNPDCAECLFNKGMAELENKGPGGDEPGHYRRGIELLLRYKALSRGRPGRDDAVDAYLDEARRMADFLESEAAPKAAPPEPEPAMIPAEDASGGDGNPGEFE
jgi:tetratricopeptide (TPR) repeat protein